LNHKQGFLPSHSLENKTQSFLVKGSSRIRQISKKEVLANFEFILIPPFLPRLLKRIWFSTRVLVILDKNADGKLVFFAISAT
jgi:hypothetical protein